MRGRKKTTPENPDGKDSRLSRSFVTGAIALLFLITGYQSALLFHRTMVMSAASVRDHPDTVYIYVREKPSGNLSEKLEEASADTTEKDTLRHYSSRTSASSKAAARLYPRKIESFQFDPNSASAEELMRLGFSEKQAASIINYRAKGGRFRRKEDFARSYVVSDSVYKRLAPYIRIPKIDLNRADTAMLRTLPGIGKFYAAKIVEYRERLGGYSYKEQLMDIWHFDAEKFASIEDLVEVKRSTSTPYPLWTLPEDILAAHPYIGAEAAHGIVLFRDNTPKEEWTPANLKKAGILPAENADKLSRCLIVSP